MPIPTRVHGAFVSDQEVHRVVENLLQHGEPRYLEEIVHGGSDDGASLEAGMMVEGPDAESDPLYDQAVFIVTESRRPRFRVQRRLKVGYNRAARMIEQMEDSQIVGPLQTNGSREVLAPRQSRLEHPPRKPGTVYSFPCIKNFVGRNGYTVPGSDVGAPMFYRVMTLLVGCVSCALAWLARVRIASTRSCRVSSRCRQTSSNLYTMKS